MSAVDEQERTEDEEHDDQQADELEHDDEHGDDELEPEAEPARDPAEGLEEPTDQMIAELQAACNDHHDHVRGIMGGFVDGFVPCEECNGIGLAIPRPAGPKFADAPQTIECNLCNGLGELKTGSSRQGYELIQCTRCGGKGYVGPDNVPADTATQQAVESYPQQPDAQPPAPADTQPPSTDPRVQALRAEGFIVLEKPNA